MSASFSFDPAIGSLYVNDVGPNTFEEIDVTTAGGDYGWPGEEGPGPDVFLIDPLFFYGHRNSATTDCAITGGAVSRGDSFLPTSAPAGSASRTDRRPEQWSVLSAARRQFRYRWPSF